MCLLQVFNIALILVCFPSGIKSDLGDGCTTPNGETAICVSIYDCTLLLKAVKTKQSNQLDFLRESQCGFRNHPLVCCGSENNYVAADRFGKFNTKTGGGASKKNSALPDRTACGFQETDRILDGEDADMDEFPWMAILMYQKNTGQRSFSCGGSLINQRYVLTAAHCIVGEILNVKGKLVSVRLGEWNTDTEEDCNIINRRKICSDKPIDVGVESTIVHENYDVNNDNRYNDIALVRLSRKVSYTNYIRPICLPLPNEASRVGERLSVAGWGKTLLGSRSAIKQRLKVPFVDLSSCTRTFRKASIELGDSQICAGGEKNKDSCKGDSGGPLMTTTRSDRAQWYLEGIVSFGAKCGTEGWPAVYTKVSSYLQWINKNIRN